jgi:addiction module RelE/StbE family toxin
VTLRITRRAQRHLDGIADYVGERNPEAARRIGARIREIFDLLAAFPLIGREGVLAGTREMAVPGLPYVVVYRVDNGAVVILGVYHGAQLRPGQERPGPR